MECIICRCATRVLHDSQFDLDYECCSNCGFIAQDRDELITFSDERVEYDRHENNIENEGYVNFFKRFIDASLIPYAELGDGLDFGSGPEPVLSQVMTRDYDVTPDIYDLHYQPKKVYEGKLYDFIVSTEVIEHVKDPKAILKLFHEHLKPGGIAAIMTLFHEDEDEKFLKWWYRRDVTHISFFVPMTFEVLAEEVGFDLVFCDEKRYITLRKQ